MDTQKCVGKIFEYLTHSGEKRIAIVEKIDFHEGLGKEVYVGKSPFGHEVKL